MKSEPQLSAQLKKKHDNEFELSGDLSFQTVPALSGRLHQLLNNKTSLVINLAGVQRSDSAGVALLVDWLRQAQQQQVDLQYSEMPEQMRSIASVGRLDEILPLASES